MVYTGGQCAICNLVPFSVTMSMVDKPKFAKISEVPNVNVPIGDDLERAKRAYVEDFHVIGGEQHGPRYGLQWLLGEKTFDWHFLCALNIDETFPENGDDPRGYRIHIAPNAFYRLWDENGVPREGFTPECYGLSKSFELFDYSREKDRSVEKKQERHTRQDQ